MKNEKIKELHKKHIETLEAKIKNLEKQNSILNNKNIFLEAKLDENNKIVDKLTKRILSIQNEYEKAIKSAKELKDEYKKLINEALDEKKKFKKESSAFIKRIKKIKLEKDLGG